MSTNQIPLTLGQVFKASFTLYKTAFWKILPLSIFAVILEYLTHSYHYDGHHHPLNPMASWAFCILMTLLQFYLFASLLLSYQQTYQTEKISIRKTLKNAVCRFPVFILIGLIALILISIGMMFAFHPGLILSIYFFMVTPLVFLERRGIWGTLKTSLCFVHRNFWKTVLISLVSSVLLGLCTFGMKLPLSFHLIFGLAYFIVFPWTVALSFSFYLYLKERFNQPNRQKFYALLHERPKAVKLAAWANVIYILVTFISFSFSLLRLEGSLSEADLYSFLDALLATSLLLSLSIVFMVFAYAGGRLARICMIVITALMAVLFTTQLSLSLTHINSEFISGILIFSNILMPLIGLISNIMIIVFLVKAKHWYQAIRVLKINEDLENLKTEMPNHSV